MTEPAPPPLPARPDLRPGEDIAALLARTASANHTTVRELTGLQVHSRVWEEPPDDLLHRVAALTSTAMDELRPATLRGAYPGMAPERARTGRRYAGQPATCPQCQIATVAARLNIVVLCPNCGCFLHDAYFPHPSHPGPDIEAVHREMLATLCSAGESQRARDRLTRLESLMAGLEHALWTNWPPLLPGESTLWREAVVDFLRWGLQPGRVVARPPYISATTLALTWAASATQAAARDLADQIAIMGDPWLPARDLVPRWPDAHTGCEAVLSLILDHGIHVGHIPTTMRRNHDPLVLPEAARTIRTAEAVALTTLVAQARNSDLSIRDIHTLHAATINPQVARLAEHITEDVDTYRRLAAHLAFLLEEGLPPLAQRREALRNVKMIPHGVIEKLPAAAAHTPDAGRLAAAWVWLDATLGRPAGGPHAQMAPRLLLAFDHDLNPEGRLLLRDWWQHHLQLSATVAVDALPRLGRAHGERRVS